MNHPRNYLLLELVWLAALPMVNRAQVSSGACNLWTLSSNTNYAGGTANSASSLSACQAACIAQSSCVAIDWNTVQSAGSQCYILTSLSGTKFSGQNSGINHYDLNRACQFGTSVQSSATTLPPTCIRWTATVNVNYAGGIANSASTVADCQSACLASSTCVAIDWNPDTRASSNCWLLNSLAGPKFSGTNSGITHYDLSLSCSTGAYKIIYSQSPQTQRVVATIDPATNWVKFVNDITQATIFVETTCLAASTPGFTSASNCVSWFPYDKPGYYLRQYLGKVTLQPLASQIFPDRFAQDASFIVSVLANSNSLIRPAVWKNTFDAYSVDESQNLVIDPPATSPFNFASYSIPNLPITDSCPRVWTSVNKVDISQKIFVDLPTNSPVCRQQCLVDANCVGILFGQNQCFFVSSSSNFTLKQPSGSSFIFYELHSARSCTRGRTFTWSLSSTPVGQPVYGYRYNDLQSCIKSCLSNSNGTCIGISDPTIFFPYCIVYVVDRFPVGFNSNTTNSTTLLAPSLKFSANGPCDPVTNIILFKADPGATQQAGVTGEDNCRTACINNPKCKGFQLDINNGNCFLSLTSNPNLLNSSTRHHFEIIFKACGNGCQDKWDFYANVKMVGATEQTSYATERDCRLACQRLTTCFKVDWDTVNSKCYFGSSDTPLAPANYYTGWNHYELFPTPYCNEDRAPTTSLF